MARIRTLACPALILVAIVALAGAATRASGATLFRHIRLVKSEPAANDTLAKSPAAIKLWFSEKVELPVTTVKLADAAGHAVALAAVARPGTGDSAPVVAAIAKPLAAGSYVITWSTAAKDGHPANGTIAFVVKGAR
jgi:methionine-rich copper-binding protein CopC